MGSKICGNSKNLSSRFENKLEENPNIKNELNSLSFSFNFLKT